jgi:hypothetical protein
LFVPKVSQAIAPPQASSNSEDKKTSLGDGYAIEIVTCYYTDDYHMNYGFGPMLNGENYSLLMR